MNHLTLIEAPTIRIKNWADHGELHRFVMGLFQSVELPGEPTQKRLASSILFRVDEVPSGKILLVRSDVAPTNLPRGARTKSVPHQMPSAGTPVRFRITVNAIHRSRPSDPSIKRGKGTSPIDEMAEWLTAKLADAVEEVTIFQHDRSVVTSGRAPLQLDAIDGYALVKDGAALAALMRTGVGRSKAFGCGLLTVARA